jgi:hypothetical protein
MNGMNIEYRPLELPNVGVLEAKVPPMVMAAMRAEVDQIQKDFDKGEAANSKLAGNLEREYALNTCRATVEAFILQVAQIYQQKHTIELSQASRMVLDGLWCNFQKATEFNPNHTHSGLLSFVIWVQVPYDSKQELERSPGRHGTKNIAGCFELLYNNTIGDLATMVVAADRSWEARMLMFPARMAHCVYPFYTSQDYRISVSGNIVASQLYPTL